MEKIKEIGRKIKGYFRDKKITKKEGLYIGIFTVICVALISGVIVLKNVKSDKVNKVNKPAEKDIALEIPEVPANTGGMENSERVEKDKEKETAKAVSNTPKLEFVNPVEGKLLRGYDDEYFRSEDNMKVERVDGIAIASKIGSDVKAGEAGVIDEIKNNDITFGTTVVIKHANGIKSEYCNLDTNLKVKKGDTVKKGQVIGKVGKTAQSLNSMLKCEFLHIKMSKLQDKEYKSIDPGKYFSYKK